jgi:hypothetical protein
MNGSSTVLRSGTFMKKAVLSGFMLFLAFGCGEKKNGQAASSIDLGAMLQPVPKHSILEHEDYWVWGASMVRTQDGTCHLFYSRWSKEFEFKDWIYQSEIAYATAAQPDGPYTFQRVVLKGRGEAFWNKKVAHNPHIKKFGDRYFLYFISYNEKDWGLGHRLNHIFSQRIGVSVASAPDGRWEVCDQPLVDLQEGKAAHGYVTNPSVCQRPDGSYLMLMKSRPENWRETEGFTSVHCIANAPTPIGPFTIEEKAILTESTAEDPFLWYQDDRYYAIVDDQYGNYLGEKGMALFESMEGVDWKPSKNRLVSKVEITWEDQTTTLLRHLERPQLWFDETGQPSMLFCAAQVMKADEHKQEKLHSFNVHIPLAASANE